MARPLVLTSSAVGFSRADPAATTQGKLRFRGGVLLTSTDHDFGGLSGLLVSADGRRFIAVSDEAHWVTGTLEYEGGNLARAAGKTIAPMLDLAGKPMAAKAGDAEGLASAEDGDPSGDLFVSFEGEHRVWRYPFGKDGVHAVPVDLPLPPEVHRAPHNGGIEGITRIADGMLFAVSERYLDEAGDYRAWILPFDRAGSSAQHPATPGSAAAPGGRAVSLLPLRPFVMTDVHQLPDGDLLTLERRYSPVRGVGVQLRRIPGASLREPAESGKAIPAMPLDGEVVATFDADYEIDNMEGLSVRRAESGETLVYVVSDDNFNAPLQRTLLFMYELQP